MERIPVSTTIVKRLALIKQHLAGVPPRNPGAKDILLLIQDLPFVQWDPVAVVAPSHLISIWSRLGRFRPSDLDRLLWKDRNLLLLWTPIAFLVPTRDYPLYNSLMKRYPESLTNSWGSQRVMAREFLAQNRELRRRMRKDLERGPLRIDQFRDYVRTRKGRDAWSSENLVSNMIHHMHMSGEAFVVGHEGNQNIWGSADRSLPAWVEKGSLTEGEFEREAAQKAILGLGTATRSEITYYFVPGRYQNLKHTLARLVEESVIQRVAVEGASAREERFIHRLDVPILDSIEGDGWQPRTSLIPPFDNILRGTARTKAIFGFDYVREQFLPKEKRRFGTYVLPILRGDSLIGRIDPQFKKDDGALVINSVHAEPGAPKGREVAKEISDEIQDLAQFIGAKDVTYSERVPEAWRSQLR